MVDYLVLCAVVGVAAAFALAIADSWLYNKWPRSLREVIYGVAFLLGGAMGLVGLGWIVVSVGGLLP